MFTIAPGVGGALWRQRAAIAGGAAIGLVALGGGWWLWGGKSAPKQPASRPAAVQQGPTAAEQQAQRDIAAARAEAARLAQELAVAKAQVAAKQQPAAPPAAAPPAPAKPDPELAKIREEMAGLRKDLAAAKQPPAKAKEEPATLEVLETAPPADATTLALGAVQPTLLPCSFGMRITDEMGKPFVGVMVHFVVAGAGGRSLALNPPGGIVASTSREQGAFATVRVRCDDATTVASASASLPADTPWEAVNAPGGNWGFRGPFAPGKLYFGEFRVRPKILPVSPK